MPQLKDFLQNAQFNKTQVQFPHGKSTIRLWEYDYELSVELDSQKKIKEISHNAEDELWTPYFELFCQNCLNKYIDQTLHFDFSTLYLEEICKDYEFIDLYEDGNLPFVFLPSFLMKKIYFQLNGEETNLCGLENQDTNSLICRCFGVFQDQIEEKVNAGEAKTTKEITDLLLAGGGCSSCLEDIDEIISRLIPEESIPLDEKTLISLNKYLKALYLSKVFFKTECPSIDIATSNEILIICKDVFDEEEKNKIELSLRDSFTKQFSYSAKVTLSSF